MKEKSKYEKWREIRDTVDTSEFEEFSLFPFLVKFFTIADLFLIIAIIIDLCLKPVYTEDIIYSKELYKGSYDIKTESRTNYSVLKEFYNAVHEGDTLYIAYSPIFSLKKEIRTKVIDGKFYKKQASEFIYPIMAILGWFGALLIFLPGNKMPRRNDSEYIFVRYQVNSFGYVIMFPIFVGIYFWYKLYVYISGIL